MLSSLARSSPRSSFSTIMVGLNVVVLSLLVLRSPSSGESSSKPPPAQLSSSRATAIAAPASVPALQCAPCVCTAAPCAPCAAPKAAPSCAGSPPAPLVAPAVPPAILSSTATEPFCTSDPATCSGRGTCLVDRCFCDIGATGERCEGGTLRHCETISVLADKLTCFYDPQWGSSKIDHATWSTALQNELGIWRGAGFSNDRANDHTDGFGGFAALPRNASLGRHAEFGCGPWTQTLTALLSARPDLSFTSITLSDPNLFSYIKEVPGCSYSTGALRDHPPGTRVWPSTVLVSAGAEEPIFGEAFDSLLMCNVLEHVQDAYAVLHNVWASLKPGGILMLSEHWWSEFSFHDQVQLNNLLHPTRVRQPVFDYFMTHFDILHSKRASDNNADGIFFIGRKKALATRV